MIFDYHVLCITGLRGRAGFAPSGGEWELPSVAVLGFPLQRLSSQSAGSSACVLGSRALGHGSVAVARRLSCSVARGIFRTRDGTRVCAPAVASLPLSHREVPERMTSGVIPHGTRFHVINKASWDVAVQRAKMVTRVHSQWGCHRCPKWGAGVMGSRLERRWTEEINLKLTQH